LNNAFIETLVARVRELVKEALRRGAAVAIVVDPINSENLRGTPLQGTLPRAEEVEELGSVRGRALRGVEG
jgi:predicted xylose isomerase-like sugar epimerase